MSRVVVTGAAGFIGSNLVKRLAEEGHEVVAIIRRPEQADRLAGAGIQPHVADVTNTEALAAPLHGAAVVYHLAGRIHAVSLAKFRAVNVRGTLGVAEASAACRTPPTLVVVSSLAAAGPSEAGRPRTERDPPAPISQYGVSKFEGEQAARQWAGEVPISIVRPPFVFGGGDRASLPLFRMIRRWGAQVIPRGHDLELSLIHVQDFIEALLLVAKLGRRIERCGDNSASAAPRDQCDPAAGVYSPADPTVIAYTQMGRLIGQPMGREVRVWRIWRQCLWAACAFNAAIGQVTGRPGVLNLDKLREATAAAWTCSNEKSRRELGFLPHSSLGERLAETVAWYEAAGWL
jgi:nucleoside-diphosphate-sugar epimerase